MDGIWILFHALISILKYFGDVNQVKLLCSDDGPNCRKICNILAISIIFSASLNKYEILTSDVLVCRVFVVCSVSNIYTYIVHILSAKVYDWPALTCSEEYLERACAHSPFQPIQPTNRQTSRHSSKAKANFHVYSSDIQFHYIWLKLNAVEITISISIALAVTHHASSAQEHSVFLSECV